MSPESEKGLKKWEQRSTPPTRLPDRQTGRLPVRKEQSTRRPLVPRRAPIRAQGEFAPILMSKRPSRWAAATPPSSGWSAASRRGLKGQKGSAKNTTNEKVALGSNPGRLFLFSSANTPRSRRGELHSSRKSLVIWLSRGQFASFWEALVQPMS